MRNLIFCLIAGTLLLGSCKKKDSTNSTGSSVDGNWTIAVYDGVNLTAPNSGTLKLSNGNADYSLNFGGTTTEKDTYVLSSSNSKITFTKVSGASNTLSGGGTWSINQLDAHNLKMTSQYGLIINMTK